ncbi:hypothetical protein ACTVZO_11475 [Streptomyces sp. IBSNAI002]|uniref:hypothetical protein n=1 Tax=Streptomyces sp. IBSNAI002 TaxID=3457500 RepID=UPI003FD4B37C
MAQSALDLIGSHPELVVITTYAFGGDFRQARRNAYAGLLRETDRRLALDGLHAELVIDGDGTDRLYEDVHSRVRPGRIAGPALQVPAHESIRLQAADLVAYTACQAIARQERREPMWHWYKQHLPKAAPPREC